MRKPHRPANRPGRHTTRRGSVLLVVFVLVTLLTYGVYGFTQRMLAESAASVAYGQAVTAEAMAESGIELAAAYVAVRAADPAAPLSLYHRPDLFGRLVLRPSGSPRGTGRVSLVAPVGTGATAGGLRFGLIDESAKLNLNAIAAHELAPEEERLLLMNLPGMTQDIADAILDYLDDDAEPRALGAEGEYYGSLSPPAIAKDGPLASLEELLSVRGVTPDLLYGEDANRNGLLDPNENDGPATLPIDDADGFLRLGWESFLTVHGTESNLNPVDGTPKIDINDGILTDLAEAVETALGPEEAQFIIAYRVFGPSNGLTTAVPGSGGSGAQSNATPDERAELDKLASALAKGIGSSGGQPSSYGGIDTSKGAKAEIGSLFDLIGREVEATIDGSSQTLTSPWTGSNAAADLATLAAVLSVSEAPTLPGRVNVNEAPREVLLGLPGMTVQLADAIIAGRPQPGAGPAEMAGRESAAWLVDRGLTDLDTMRTLDRYLTGRGDVFRVRSVGFFDGGGPAVRVEAILDGTTAPVRIVEFRDLTGLGSGYTPAQLLPAGAVPAG